MKRMFWAIAGGLALALGLVGILLPMVPTVPFLLLAAFCFARSSQRLHDWLIQHPQFGPPIQDWRKKGAIRRRAKILATLSMGGAFGVSVALTLAPWVLTAQAVVLAAVATFIWTRPEG